MINLCIAANSNYLQRWQQAFPDGERFASTAGHLLDDAIVWLFADGLTTEQFSQDLATLVASRPPVKVVVMSLTPDNRGALDSFRKGAAGYCHALSTAEVFRQIEMIVANGGLWLGQEFKQGLAAALGRMTSPGREKNIMPLLSGREQEVARKVADGLSNREIAAALYISERTVKAHLSSIFEKTGVRDRLQLALLVSPDDQP